MIDRVPPRRDTTYSIEGTKAHIVLNAALDNRIRSAKVAHRDYSELCMEDLDEHDHGEYKMFYSSIDRMLEEVYEILDQFPDAVLWTETYVEPPSRVAQGDCGGWCDCAIYVPGMNRLWVFDYKHGAGVTKAINTNRQVKQYAAGFVYDPMSPLTTWLHEQNYDIIAPPDVITLVIVQPRAFSTEGDVRAIDVTALDLWQYLEEMDATIELNEKDDAPLVPGEEQCQFCDAKVECPARQAVMLAATRTHFHTVRHVFVDKLPQLDAMTPEDFAWGSYAFPLMEKYIKEFYERRNELMRMGVEVPGFKFVETDAKRDWYEDPKVFAPKLAALIGCDEAELWREPKFITITEAENKIITAFRKVAARGKKDDASEEARKAFAVFTDKKPTGNWTVVEATDPRPAVMLGAANFESVAGLIPPPTGE